jgi:hypothetical protein
VRRCATPWEWRTRSRLRRGSITCSALARRRATPTSKCRASTLPSPVGHAHRPLHRLALLCTFHLPLPLPFRLLPCAILCRRSLPLRCPELCFRVVSHRRLTRDVVVWRVCGVWCVEGGRWGFGEGEWGQAPTDAFGRPLYGDVYGRERKEDVSRRCTLPCPVPCALCPLPCAVLSARCAALCGMTGGSGGQDSVGHNRGGGGRA